MAARRIALIGSRGHFTTAAGELDKLAGLQIVGISAGNDDAAPIKKWCAAKGHSPIEDDDYKAMLDRARPDIAIVAGPFEQHAEMSVQAIGRGIHVLTEKPAALTFDQLKQFKPTLIGVSAGFDAYARDPLAQETLEAEDFYWLGQKIRALNIPTFSLLEGGYSRDLPDLILSYLKGIEGK